MTIKSMTGFARADGAIGPLSWHWEVRSVNGRGLDIRLRLPPGYEALEPRIREAAGKRIARGSLTINLNVKRSEGGTQIRLNEAALRQVLAALDSLQGHDRGGAAARRGAARHQGRAGGGRAARRARPRRRRAPRPCWRSLAEALDGMVRAREAEGRRLRPSCATSSRAIERLVAADRGLARRARPRPSASG